MDWSEILLKILNNASIAGIITVGLGVIIGGHVYRHQKDLDRRYSAEDKLAENFLLFMEHCKSINQSIDRLVNTITLINKEKNAEATQKFIKESLPAETAQAAQMLMYTVPEDISRIETIVSLYFNGDKKIETAVRIIFDEIKIWHDSTQNYITGKSGTFDSMKRVKDTPELSLNSLDTKIKELFSLFKKR